MPAGGRIAVCNPPDKFADSDHSLQRRQVVVEARDTVKECNVGAAGLKLLD